MSGKYHESYFHFDKSRNSVWRAIASYLQSEIPENSKILDLGAGYCDFINNIVSEEKHALDTFKDLPKYANKDVIIHIQSCSDMSNFKDNYFNVIFASNFLEHLKEEDLTRILSEIYRILTVGGKLIIIQPNFKYAYQNYFDDYTHRLIFTHISLSAVLTERRFNVERIIPRFLPLSMKSWLPKNEFIVKLYLKSPIKPLAKQMLIIARKGV